MPICACHSQQQYAQSTIKCGQNVQAEQYCAQTVIHSMLCSLMETLLLPTTKRGLSIVVLGGIDAANHWHGK